MYSNNNICASDQTARTTICRAGHLCSTTVLHYEVVLSHILTLSEQLQPLVIWKKYILPYWEFHYVLIYCAALLDNTLECIIGQYKFLYKCLMHPSISEDCVCVYSVNTLWGVEVKCSSVILTGKGCSTHHRT